MMSYGAHEGRPWALDEPEAEPIIRRAIEGGITFFDTADVYNGGASEVVSGRLLRPLLGMRGADVVGAKVGGAARRGEGGRGVRRRHVLASIVASLERRGLGFVDRCQVVPGVDLVEVEETMEA